MRTLAPRMLGRAPAGTGVATAIAPSTLTRSGALQQASRIATNARSVADLQKAGNFVLYAVYGVNTTAAAQVRNYVNQAVNPPMFQLVPFKSRQSTLTYAIMWAGVTLAGVGLGAPPAYRVGMGDLNVNDTQLGVTAAALMSNLNSAGCQQAFSQPVSDFQSAYNTAGGTPALTVDGLYGALTQAALQTTINGLPSPIGLTGSTAPAGCVAAASSAGSLNVSPTTVTGTVPSSSSATIGGTDLVPLAIAGVAAAGLIGLAIYAKKKKGFRIIHRRPVHHARHAYR